MKGFWIPPVFGRWCDSVDLLQLEDMVVQSCGIYALNPLLVCCAFCVSTRVNRDCFQSLLCQVYLVVIFFRLFLVTDPLYSLAKQWWSNLWEWDTMGHYSGLLHRSPTYYPLECFPSLIVPVWIVLQTSVRWLLSTILRESIVLSYDFNSSGLYNRHCQRRSLETPQAFRPFSLRVGYVHWG